MSRISKALDKLRTKCTEAGVHPSGKRTADILECIAEHFEVGGGSFELIIVETINAEGTSYAANHTYAEVVAKIEAKEPMHCVLYESNGQADAFSFYNHQSDNNPKYVGIGFVVYDDENSIVMVEDGRIGLYNEIFPDENGEDD